MRRIGGVILAAGGSTRMGEPKQVLELQDEPLVHAAVRAAQEGGCDIVCVVTGNAREAVEAAVADLGPVLAHNETWRSGMGGSVRHGVRAVLPASAVVLLACDQPAVTAETIRSLIDAHDRTGQRIVASRYAGTLGVPAIFDQSCFGELCALAGDRGAKTLIQADLARVAMVDFPDGAHDLDSPDDFLAWRSRGRG